MSAFSDAMTAVRNVILMQSRLERLERDVEHLSDNLDGLKDYAFSLDKRLVRIETVAEMGGPPPRRLTGPED